MSSGTALDAELLLWLRRHLGRRAVFSAAFRHAERAPRRDQQPDGRVAHNQKLQNIFGVDTVSDAQEGLVNLAETGREVATLVVRGPLRINLLHRIHTKDRDSISEDEGNFSTPSNTYSAVEHSRRCGEAGRRCRWCGKVTWHELCLLTRLRLCCTQSAPRHPRIGSMPRLGSCHACTSPRPIPFREK